MRLLGGVAIWVLLGAGLAAAAGPPASQPDSLSDAELRALVAQLNDRAYRTREAASQRLAQLDFAQIDRLVPLFKSAGRPEQQLRLRRAAQEIFLAAKRSGHSPEGFLGVTHIQSERDLVLENVQPVPDVRKEAGADQWVSVVHVNGVLADSPAAQAGLRTGDQIVAVDGQPIRSQAEGGFAEQIRRMRPGQKVRLAVRRDDRPVEVVATLGNRGRFDLDENVADWTNQFNRFWRERFDPADSTGDAAAGVRGQIIIHGGARLIVGQ